MGADKAVRCDCGHEARGSEEPALVDAIRRHALDAHGIDLPVELALGIAGTALPVPGGDDRKETG